MDALAPDVDRLSIQIVRFDWRHVQRDARWDQAAAWFQQSIAGIDQRAEASCLQAEGVVDVGHEDVGALGQGSLRRGLADEPDAIEKARARRQQLSVRDGFTGFDRVDVPRAGGARQKRQDAGAGSEIDDHVA